LGVAGSFWVVNGNRRFEQAREKTAMAEEIQKGSGSSKMAQSHKSDSAAKASQVDHDATRRRVIKAGVIGVPLILTLKARPASAQDGGSTTPSLTHSTVPGPPPKP